MNGPAPGWMDAALMVLLVAGNLLALPLWIWLVAGVFARGRWVVSQFRSGPAARQAPRTGDRLGA